MKYKIRIATKKHEKEILSIASKLRENPFIILPECRCKKCPFEKIKKEIERLKDENYLKKAAKGKGLISALAATIMMDEEHKIPYIAFRKMGNEDVFYAKRGKAKDEYLIAVQNWDKPNLRLLAYLNIARKKKIGLFSVEDKLICSDDVPPEFMKFIGSRFRCNDKDYILLKWRGNEIKLCGKGNSIMELTQYFYHPSFEKEAEIEVHAEFFECAVQCKECIIKDAIEQKIDASFYLKGRMSDEKFISNYRNKVMWEVEKKKVFIAGNKCYGNSMEEFMNVLKPKEWEVDEIRKILEDERKAIILEQASSAKLLEKYGIDSMKLKEEWMNEKIREKMDKLPPVGNGKISRFIDRIAREYIIEGKEGVEKIAKDAKDVKEKAISYAFIKAAGAKIEGWKYSDMEKEFGEYLIQYASAVLKARGNEYKEAVNRMAKEAGE
ncbi:MAG: hypothetical protein J7K61_04755 [Thermoplasmata archaeon]|nr:hypothetical protein [Thermoplasmata archaeon]